MPVFRLTSHLVFPDPELAGEDGLLAVGGDLSPERLILAYSSGIFPWFNEGSPILWHSPDPRLVLFPEKFKVSKSLRQIIKKGKYTVNFNSCFEQVIRNCAQVNRMDQDGTWITEKMIRAYIKLHQLGYAHSVETYEQGKLAGGLYGVSLGKAFFGESMFHLRPDASKVALYYLVETLKEHHYHFIDSQVHTNHLVSMGAEEISRKNYLLLLENALKKEFWE